MVLHMTAMRSSNLVNIQMASTLCTSTTVRFKSTVIWRLTAVDGRYVVYFSQCNNQSRSLIDRSFGRPSLCIAVDLWSRIDRVRRDDRGFTVRFFVPRGCIVARPVTNNFMTVRRTCRCTRTSVCEVSTIIWRYVVFYCLRGAGVMWCSLGSVVDGVGEAM